MMTNIEFITKLMFISEHVKTLYVMGGIGQPLTAAAKKQLINQYDYNKGSTRQNLIMSKSADTFAFDCVGVIKSVLWGFCANKNKYLGGAEYQTNAVPDIGADGMIKRCNGVSKDFSSIEIGEAVHMSGHIGVYVGNGNVVECTPAFKNCVQITDLKTRKWTEHGKLPYIKYNSMTNGETKKTDSAIADEVIRGKWGNGAERKKKLTEAGYDYEAIQKIVNEKLNAPKKKSNSAIADEVIRGKWGNGAERKNKMTEAGYDYEAIQAIVNEKLKK